ncbi:MAG: erythritol/L-threitol dehydrogenase [Thermomicrobiales bacterium]|jgi:L-iditol 2-dehydrogenase|nr:erythritol/L-threitol dehydrogenase [Thermomicrobiales bacterium]
MPLRTVRWSWLGRPVASFLGRATGPAARSTINWAIIGDTKELTIHGSHLGPYCYPKVIDALATGKVDVKPLLADAYPIAELDRAMKASLSGGVLKNLIVP